MKTQLFYGPMDGLEVPESAAERLVVPLGQQVTQGGVVKEKHALYERNNTGERYHFVCVVLIPEDKQGEGHGRT